MFTRRVLLSKFLHGQSWCSRSFQYRVPRIFLSSTTSEEMSVTLPSNKLSITVSIPKDTDILSEQLLKAKSMERIFDLVSQHHSVMNNRQIMSAYRVLFAFIKDKKDKDIWKKNSEDSFHLLCNRTLKRMRYFELDDVILLLKVGTALEVPSESGFIQGVLQMIRHNINSLTLTQIVFVDFLLSRHKETPLIEALKLALPLVLQAQLSVQIDPDNVVELCRCFCYAFDNNCDENTLEKLSHALLKQADNLSVEQAIAVVLTLSSMYPLPPYASEIVEISKGILAKDLNKLPSKSVRALISAAGRNTYIYSKDLFKSLADLALTQNWDLWQVNLLLLAFFKHEYVSTELLDYVSESAVKKADLFREDSRVSIITVANTLALPHYQAPDAKDAAQIISSCQEKINLLQENTPILFVRLVSCITMLNCFPKELLQKVFSTAFLDVLHYKVPPRKKTELYTDLLQLDQSLKLDLKDYPGPYLADNVREECIDWLSRNNTINQIILKSLEIAFGGLRFILPSMWTKYGHYIDFAIVMRKGDYPVALNQSGQMETQEIRFIEDISVPEESKILMVILANKSCFCHEPPMLKRAVAVKLRHLSKLGYYPLLVNVEAWQDLLDHEKIPYLMREAKEALNNAESVQAAYLIS